MQARMSQNPVMIVPDALQALQTLRKSAEQGAVPSGTIGLVQLRASQINGCSACVDQHSRFLKRAASYATPVMLTEQHGQRWLISSYGQLNWVRNLRAAGEATLQRGRQTERICAVELSAREVALYRGLGCPQLHSLMDLVEAHENQEKRKPQQSSYRDE